MKEGEYKCKIFKMHLKLRAQQLKSYIYICIYIHTHTHTHTHTHIYRLLYKKLMVTSKQTPIIDIHTKKEKRIQTQH